MNDIKEYIGKDTVVVIGLADKQFKVLIVDRSVVTVDTVPLKPGDTVVTNDGLTVSSPEYSIQIVKEIKNSWVFTNETDGVGYNPENTYKVIAQIGESHISNVPTIKLNDNDLRNLHNNKDRTALIEANAILSECLTWPSFTQHPIVLNIKRAQEVLQKQYKFKIIYVTSSLMLSYIKT